MESKLEKFTLSKADVTLLWSVLYFDISIYLINYNFNREVIAVRNFRLGGAPRNVKVDSVSESLI